MFGLLVGHETQACNLQKNVRRVVEVAGVGSSLKAPKNKGEGDGSGAFQGACDERQGIEKLQIVFHAFGGPKTPQWGGLI